MFNSLVLYWCVCVCVGGGECVCVCVCVWFHTFTSKHPVHVCHKKSTESVCLSITTDWSQIVWENTYPQGSNTQTHTHTQTHRHTHRAFFRKAESSQVHLTHVSQWKWCKKKNTNIPGQLHRQCPQSPFQLRPIKWNTVFHRLYWMHVKVSES